MHSRSHIHLGVRLWETCGEAEEAVEEAAVELYLTRHSSGLRGRQKHANAVTTILLCRDPYTHFVQKRAGGRAKYAENTTLGQEN